MQADYTRLTHNDHDIYPSDAPVVAKEDFHDGRWRGSNGKLTAFSDMDADHLHNSLRWARIRFGHPVPGTNRYWSLKEEELIFEISRRGQSAKKGARR